MMPTSLTFVDVGPNFAVAPPLVPDDDGVRVNTLRAPMAAVKLSMVNAASTGFAWSASAWSRVFRIASNRLSKARLSIMKALTPSTVKTTHTAKRRRLASRRSSCLRSCLSNLKDFRLASANRASVDVTAPGGALRGRTGTFGSSMILSSFSSGVKPPSIRSPIQSAWLHTDLRVLGHELVDQRGVHHRSAVHDHRLQRVVADHGDPAGVPLRRSVNFADGVRREQGDPRLVPGGLEPELDHL